MAECLSREPDVSRNVYSMKSQQFCFDRPAVDLGSIACCLIKPGLQFNLVVTVALKGNSCHIEVAIAQELINRQEDAGCVGTSCSLCVGPTML